jgi:uncharacterized protein YndB with AHSA1/START domain
MSDRNLTYTVVVDQTPEQVFDVIRNVRGWWSKTISGDTHNLHDVFTYEVEGVHKCTMQLIEFIPNQKLVWHVMENWFSFVTDKSEWVDTNVVFNIAEKNGKTEIRFTHVGLTAHDECFDVCHSAWGGYITVSLRNLIETGTGNPNQERDEDLAPLRAG